MNAKNQAAPEAAEPGPQREPDAPDRADDAADRIVALEAEVQAARAQAAENQDRLLRARAETENLRRRAEADLTAAHKYAIERFALEMLAVRDSLERAREVHATGADSAGELERMIEGLELTLRLMDSVFGKFGLVEVAPAAGERFDPQHHQAMSTQESPDIPANHVLHTVQKGYLLQDRLLRPAMVIVARAPAGPPPDA